MLNYSGYNCNIMPGKLIAALSIYSVVLVTFFLTGVPSLWAFMFGVVASSIGYAGGLQISLPSAA